MSALNHRFGVAVRQHVHLDAQRRQVEGVDHVLRDHVHDDVLADRHVQVVDLGLAAGMLELPHPLPADGVDLQPAGRQRLVPHEELRPPGEEEQREQEGPDHPGHLDGRGPDLAVAPVRLHALAVDQGEPREGDEDRHGEEQRQHREGQDQVIRLHGAGRGRGGPDVEGMSEAVHGVSPAVMGSAPATSARRRGRRPAAAPGVGSGSSGRPTTSAWARAIGMRPARWSASVQA